MKKSLLVNAAIIVTLFVMMVVPQNVHAKSDPSPLPDADKSKPGVAEGSWVITTGTGVDYDAAADASLAPNWLQLLVKGVQIEKASKICHPLRGGQYGWVGEIRQFKNGKWIKLPTVNDWVPSKEGIYMSCAEAPSAGKYALFGYYIRPANAAIDNPAPGPGCAYSTADWELSTWGENPYGFQVLMENMPIGTSVTYILTANEDFPGPPTANTILDEYHYVTYNRDYLDPNATTLTIEILALGCSKSFEYPFTPLD